MDQLTQFDVIARGQELLTEHGDFESILERVGKRKFSKKDLDFYFRTLGEIEDRIKNQRSLIKTFIMAIGRFNQPDTVSAMAGEAMEQMDTQTIETILLLSELANGKEAEFSLLEKSFRRRVNQ